MPKGAVVALSPDITDTGVVLETLFDVGELRIKSLTKGNLLLIVGGGVPVNSPLLTFK